MKERETKAANNAGPPRRLFDWRENAIMDRASRQVGQVVGAHFARPAA